MNAENVDEVLRTRTKKVSYIFKITNVLLFVNCNVYFLWAIPQKLFDRAH